jgi:Phosphodiester glycosidase
VKPRPAIARAVASLLAFGVLAASGGFPAAGEPDRSARKVVKTRRIAPGLTFTKIVERKIPRRTFVLRLDLSKRITLDMTLADAALPSADQISDVVRRAGGLAGVNGGFTERGQGRPVNLFAQDGDLVQTPSGFGPIFGVTRDESQARIAGPAIAVSLTDTTTGRRFELERWNEGGPTPGELAGFSPLGGTAEAPPPFACSARLLPQGPNQPASPDGVERLFTVDVVRCAAEPLPRRGGIVISATPATKEATELLALAPGAEMRLHWTAGWDNVFDIVAGGPILLRDGEIVTTCDRPCDSHPRTGVGVTAAGEIVLVVIDGRQARWSRGVTLVHFARIMQDLGAVAALNLDGGGSSVMVVEGEVVNRPSDGRERALSNALVVLRGPDPGE